MKCAIRLSVTSPTWAQKEKATNRQNRDQLGGEQRSKPKQKSKPYAIPQGPNREAQEAITQKSWARGGLVGGRPPLELVDPWLSPRRPNFGLWTDIALLWSVVVVLARFNASKWRFGGQFSRSKWGSSISHEILPLLHYKRTPSPYSSTTLHGNNTTRARERNNTPRLRP